VIIVLPGAIPVAKPDEETVAIAGFELAQVTWVVMLEVELLELSPVAENCWVEPTARLTGSPGVIIIEDSVGEAWVKELTNRRPLPAVLPLSESGPENNAPKP
jgi:hypothetical protein